MVYQHDDLGNAGQVTNWYSAGTRVSVALTENFKVLGEVGFDRVTKSNGSPQQYLSKFTIAPTISSGKGLLTRPELRLFCTWALWNEAARIATVDSGMLFTNSIVLERLHLRRASRDLVVGVRGVARRDRVHAFWSRSRVWRAIISSSLVGITQADVRLDGRADARAAGGVGVRVQLDAQPGRLPAHPLADGPACARRSRR